MDGIPGQVAGEGLPEPLLAKPGLDLPETVPATSIEIIDKAQVLASAFAGVRTNLDRTVEHLRPETVGELLLDGLVEDGIITANERVTIIDTADEIATLFKSKTTVGQVSHNAFGWVFIEHEKRVDRRRRERRRTIPPAQAKIMNLAHTIAERGKRLTSMEQVNHLERPLRTFIDNPYHSIAEQPDAFMLDRKTLNILWTMFAIDIITYTHNIPEEISSRKNAALAIPPDEQAKLLIEFMEQDNARDAMELLYDPKELYSRVAGRVKRKYEGEAVRMASYFTTHSILNRLEELQTTADQIAHDRMTVSEADTWNYIDAEYEAYEALVRELLRDVKDHLSVAPSFERMFGALVVETWVTSVDSVLAAYATPKILERAQRTTLHDAVRADRERQERERTNHAITERLTSLAVKEKQYKVSADTLREVQGALRLRRQLRGLQQPGSQAPIFDDAGARQLTVLALNPPGYPALLDDLDEMRVTWIELSTLQGGRAKREGLLRSIDTLMELYESATTKQLTDDGLRPVWELVDRLTRPQSEEPAEVSREFDHTEFLKAFPPGVTEKDIKDDLIEISRSHRPEAIAWERITALVNLKGALEQVGFTVTAHRLMQSKWHPLPHYVLEIIGPKGGVVAIVESPIHGNASYLINTHEWKLVVVDTKKEAREVWEAKARVHTAESTPKQHQDKLFREAKALL